MISRRKSKEVINIAWFGRTSHPLFKKKWHKTDIFPVLQKLTHMWAWYRLGTQLSTQLNFLLKKLANFGMNLGEEAKK